MKTTNGKRKRQQTTTARTGQAEECQAMPDLLEVLDTMQLNGPDGYTNRAMDVAKECSDTNLKLCTQDTPTKDQYELALRTLRTYPTILGRLRLQNVDVRNKLQVPRAHKAANLLLREAASVLARIAKENEINHAPFEYAATALMQAYEPLPDQAGTRYGLHYPQRNDFPESLWPDCMRADDWERLPETLRNDLLALRDTMVATMKSDKAAQQERKHLSPNEISQLRQKAAKAETTYEDAFRLILSSIPDMEMEVFKAGWSHIKGQTWEQMEKNNKCSKATLSTRINSFYEITNYPRSDRRKGMGKKVQFNENRDSGKAAKP